ncbi:hypothetical protein [Domibacillus robiginosus]|uniref:hypothetical protein n=1 Tax=Domibacillus robiginosus TaxID=1071054 RepID=UPI00067AB018|nr:hypothetical protein [Domibacillus robiginosus]
MAAQRIKVGYIELTEEESKRLLKEVQRDGRAETLEDLQVLMDKYDARMVETEDHLLEEVIEEVGEQPSVTEEEIEFFPKMESDKRYRIKAAKK